MNIHQLSVNYLPEQDRILVRINTTAGQELRVWFTRRLTLGFAPLLTKVVAEQIAKLEAAKSPYITPAATADVHTQQMLSEFKKAQALEKSDFQTPYNNQPAALPLGEEPLLITEVNLTPLAAGQLQIAFNEQLPSPAKQRGFKVVLEPTLVHGFTHLLDKAIHNSLWRQEAEPAGHHAPNDTLPGELMAGGDKPRYLN
jgi:hypothetical protein